MTLSAPARSAGPIGERDRPRATAWIAPATILGIAALLGAWALPPATAGAIALIGSILYFARRVLLSITGMTFILLIVVMFVPIRAYALPIPLPFQLEPYRLLLGLILVACAFRLLADPVFAWRPVRFAVPMVIFVGTLLLSIVVNIVPLTKAGLVGTSMSGVVNLLFILSVFFFVRQALTSERMVTAVLTFLAWAGGIVGLFAIVERVIHVNVFLLYGKLLPLTVLRTEDDSFRAGGSRSYASAQHPIALSVMLTMLIPIVLYLAQHGSWPRNRYTRWVVSAVLIVMLMGGIASAVSRTSVVVIVIMFVLTLIFRPLIALAVAFFGLPLVEFGAIVFPKTINSTLLSFLDVNSLIASQYTSAGWAGAGRLADLEPAFQQIRETPFFGIGFGSRIVVGADANSFILDNQVLGILMEAGAVGVLGFAIFILVPILVLLWHSLLSRVPRRYRDLAFAVAVSAAGYAAALFFYDAFGFMQTLLVLCVLLAVGTWVLTEAPGARLPARGADPLRVRLPRRSSP